ncbi:hypothetical protein [Clostridium perfringens]|uniref:hypothetical protein n=1 Tax=Clostridium perfringens TaxID=1502 RepID=UPI0039EA17AA
MSKITVIIGAMGSGKSALLLSELMKVNCRRDELLILKPKLDTRTPRVIMSRNGLFAPAIEVENFRDILIQRCLKDVKYIFIDEVQFIDKEGMLEFYIYCKEHNVNVFASGLDLTSELSPFDTTAKLMCYADDIVVVKGDCSCGNESRLSAFIGGSKDGDVKIGDEEYIGVCEKCHPLIKGVALK